MKLELHILQNFPPSCLNRDDTNSPKDCEFGGVRRARISSQSLKRAARQYFHSANMLDSTSASIRTKRIVDAVADEVCRSNGSFSHPEVQRAVQLLLSVSGFGTKDSGDAIKTEYLLFLPRRSLKRLAEMTVEHWSVLKSAVSSLDEKATGKEAKKDKKKKEGPDLSNEIVERVEHILADASHAPEIALFGRMIADRPQDNIDAACQVAHALSTHRVAVEFDFYTAVDDLRPRDNQGADMMGTVQFNSACFYRYAVLDMQQLSRSLAGLSKPSEKLTPEMRQEARDVAMRWLTAAVLAVPSARQNGTAAWTPPQFVLVGIRSKGMPLSLANAFVKPVRASEKHDLVQASALALGEHLDGLVKMYGSEDAEYTAAAYDNLPLSEVARRSESFPALQQAIQRRLDGWVEANA